MTAINPILVLTCLLVVLPIALTAECPSKEDVAPCACRPSPTGSLSIMCSGIDNEVLVRVASSLSGRKVQDIIITNSKLGRIPHDVFKGVRLSHLAISSSTLVDLTDRGEAFVGLEDHLENLFISDCVYQNEWDWFVLRRLKKLMSLSMYGTHHLETIGTDAMKISVPNLEYIDFSGNNISFVSDRAFDSQKNLISLALSNNKIKTLKRTMLPNPALKLETINLSNNLIQKIPVGMFTKMPNLHILILQKNKILVLNEKTFSPVWERLHLLSVTDNNLRCDCSMSWIPEKRSSLGLAGQCASPPELKGKALKKLESKDFMCY